MNTTNLAEKLPASPGIRLPQPLTREETGLSLSLLEDLVCRQLLESGVCDLQFLSQSTALSSRLLDTLIQTLKTDARIEVRGPAESSQALRYTLTDAGRRYANEAMQRSGYIGPAPITVTKYRELISQQSVHDLQVNRSQMDSVFQNVVIKPFLKDRLGSAMHSGKAIFIYGPAGTGKTFICKRLIELLQTPVYVPHAVVVGDSIVRVFDAAVHEIVTRTEAASAYLADMPDPRVILCKRPFVCSGGELTADLLEVRYDASTRQYSAPLQLKATHGIYMIDDLGRQKMSTDELFNRWIVPMESGEDFLNLQSGQRLVVPFDVILIFSTNLLPEDLDDPAFQRRIGHKIGFEYADDESYTHIWQQECARLGVSCDPAVVKFAIEELHKKSSTPMLACHPRDLIGMALDYSRYSTETDQLTTQGLTLAWNNYFARSEE